MKELSSATAILTTFGALRSYPLIGLVNFNFFNFFKVKKFFRRRRVKMVIIIEIFWNVFFYELIISD